MIPLLALSAALVLSPCTIGGEGPPGSLFHAIANSDCAEIQHALEHDSKISARDEIGATPLMRVVERNLQPECVRSLLHAGADPNATHGSQNISVLMVAASYSTAEIISLLVQSGAKVQFATPDGWTALMSAARNSSQPAVINALVTAGANINAVDQYGVTPLMRAAQNNPNAEIIDTLLQLGADLSAKSSSGHTAYDLARDVGRDKGLLEILEPRPKIKSQGGESDSR